ncbi:MAG: tRNA uridine-5-carboxymethylaminomethyl(34) synthesis GTPase MnmE [Flavobacteriaceae bacterium]|nr:tRNA uridine-5-carboxymethylaminomethyl(34) synthesis GTPase MnmE [Flavobacteriaceae bacterium]
MNPNEPIIAPATGSSVAAIAVIRLSGTGVIEITQQVFDRKNLRKSGTGRVHFGRIRDRAGIVDEVLVSVFVSPQSYTGEDVVEISCHGSPYIQQRIIQLFLDLGVRMAAPGEFTMRAFMNGKMDLAQAEAVADLIASDSKSSHEVAMNQMRGGISKQLAVLRKDLIRFSALMELELDFSDEDVEFANRDDFKMLIQNLKSHIQPLIDSFEYGNAIKQGVSVAILGKPNAGKSSLLNALLKEERAIVSDIAGTTRDTIEDVIVVDGIKLRLMDTAGLRETDDVIESMGVKRSISNALKSKLVLFLYDRRDVSLDEIYEMLKPLFDKEIHLFLIENKIDLHDISEEFLSEEFIQKIKNHFVIIQSFAISAKNTSQVASLGTSIAKYVKSWHQEDAQVITQVRHLNALQSTMLALQAIEQGMEMEIPGDLLAQDIREAIRELGSITGAIEIDRDILGTIFGEFCIGK